MTLKGALGIPVLATASLLVAYALIIHEITIIYNIFYGYMLYLCTITLKRYIYLYIKTR
jgi:hypothetical protein